MALTLLLLLLSLPVKLLYMAPWSGRSACAKPFWYFFMTFLLHFFSSYSREKFLKILDIFFADKMAANKESDNAESISIAEWQKYLETLIMTKSLMGIPRTTTKFRGLSSENQMWKVMRTEVEELGY